MQKYAFLMQNMQKSICYIFCIYMHPTELMWPCSCFRPGQEDSSWVSVEEGPAAALHLLPLLRGTLLDWKFDAVLAVDSA